MQDTRPLTALMMALPPHLVAWKLTFACPDYLMLTGETHMAHIRVMRLKCDVDVFSVSVMRLGGNKTYSDFRWQDNRVVIDEGAAELIAYILSQYQ